MVVEDDDDDDDDDEVAISSLFDAFLVDSGNDDEDSARTHVLINSAVLTNRSLISLQKSILLRCDVYSDNNSSR